MTVQCNIQWEVTDTFGGEVNYSWVKRGKIEKGTKEITMHQEHNNQLYLTPEEEDEIRRIKSYFPFRVVSGVKLQDGTFEVFANATAAKANNYARKNNGVLWRI